MRLSGSNLTGLTQSLMFLVIDSVLYLIYIKNEMEWVQLLTQLNGLTQPLMFLVIDSVLYLANNEIEIE